MLLARWYRRSGSWQRSRLRARFWSRTSPRRSRTWTRSRSWAAWRFGFWRLAPAPAPASTVAPAFRVSRTTTTAPGIASAPASTWFVFSHTNYSVRKSIPKLGVVKFPNSIFHVIITGIVHNPLRARCITKNLGEADIPCTTHVILKVLPWSRARQSGEICSSWIFWLQMQWTRCCWFAR